MKTKREIQRLLAQDSAAALIEFERMRAALGVAESKAKKLEGLYKAVESLQVGHDPEDDEMVYVDVDSFNRLLNAYSKAKL